MKQFIFAALLAAGISPLNAADLSGQWTVVQDRDFRGNPGVPAECTFKQQGSELIVKCKGAAGEMKGEVRGRKVMWGFEKTGIPPMLDDRLILTYSAEINESGAVMKGRWHLSSGVLDEKGTFEAKKK